MILPIGDAPNPRGFTAWMTWALIAMNVAIYVLWTLPLSFVPLDPTDPVTEVLVRRVLERNPRLDPALALRMLSQWDAAVQAWGYTPAHPDVVRLFASMFLHANFAHVAGNMLFLWIYGDNVEHRLGRLPYLAAYLGSGVVATLSFSALVPNSTTPLVGASGAISGILGAYFVLFPRNLVKLFVGLFPFVVDVFLVPAPLVLGAYVLFDNLLPLLVMGGGSGGVAYGAHLGGFLAGLVVGWGALRSGWRIPRDGAAQPALGGDPVAEAEALARAGNLDAAFRTALVGLRQVADPDQRARLHLVAAEILVRWDLLGDAWQHLAQARRLARDPGIRARVDRLLARPAFRFAAR